MNVATFGGMTFKTCKRATRRHFSTNFRSIGLQYRPFYVMMDQIDLRVHHFMIPFGPAYVNMYYASLPSQQIVLLSSRYGGYNNRANKLKTDFAELPSVLTVDHWFARLLQIV